MLREPALNWTVRQTDLETGVSVKDVAHESDVLMHY